MAKDSVFQIRVSLQKKVAWKEAAADAGQSLSSWLERLADEEVDRVNAEEGEAEERRAQRRLVKASVSPQGHGFGKKSYEPDYRT